MDLPRNIRARIRYSDDLAAIKRLYASNVLNELAIVRRECEKIILITEQELQKQNWLEDKNQ